MRLSELINTLSTKQVCDGIADTLERCDEILQFKIKTKPLDIIKELTEFIRNGNLPKRYDLGPPKGDRSGNFFMIGLFEFINYECYYEYDEVPRSKWNNLLMQILKIERWAYDNDKYVLDKQVELLYKIKENV